MTDPPITRDIEDAAGNRVRITPHVRDHLDQLTGMYRTFPNGERSLGLPPKRESKLEEWLTELLGQGQNFVALTDDVAGHVAYTPASAARPDLVVFVDPECQGLGIGTGLVRHAIERATAENIDGFVSYVERDNESAIGLYRKLGFEELQIDPTTIKMGIELNGGTDARLPRHIDNAD